MDSSPFIDVILNSLSSGSYLHHLVRSLTVVAICIGTSTKVFEYQLQEHKQAQL